jgi:transcriptional regulator with AAA-type ATPase domain
VEYFTAVLLLLLLLLQSEERRNRALQPYRVTTPSRGIIGNSKYADRLRRQVRRQGTENSNALTFATRTAWGSEAQLCEGVCAAK